MLNINLLTLSKEQLVEKLSASFQYYETVAFEKDNGVTLFRKEDTGAWITFTIVFAVLILFDNCVLHRNPKALTVARAACYTLFWVFTAFCFCGYVYYRYGQNAAFDWMSGYLLEWMLSFDNLFVFHLIFSVYATPDHLKHKPLYWGICGAIVFRLAFIFIGEYMMHAMFFAHLLFGAFLVYTGVNAAIADEEDEDPSKNPLVQWLSKHVPFVSAYDSKGNFFVRVPLDNDGNAILPEDCYSARRHTDEEADQITNSEDGEQVEVKYGTIDFESKANTAPTGKYQTRATMLFLVVCCLEISDILFAVDSVSAIVAQVNDLFLAYTSAVFAMLGLRATFFIIDVLVKLFSLLKYGVSAVLVFIGIKLILSKYMHIPPMIVCLILFLTLGSSMVASVIKDRIEQAQERKACDSVGGKLDETTPLKVA